MAGPGRFENWSSIVQGVELRLLPGSRGSERGGSPERKERPWASLRASRSSPEPGSSFRRRPLRSVFCAERERSGRARARRASRVTRCRLRFRRPPRSRAAPGGAAQPRPACGQGQSSSATISPIRSRSRSTPTAPESCERSWGGLRCPASPLRTTWSVSTSIPRAKFLPTRSTGRSFSERT